MVTLVEGDPYPQVVEAQLKGALDPDAVRRLYGEEAARRIRGDSAIELSLRRPMEILQ